MFLFQSPSIFPLSPITTNYFFPPLNPITRRPVDFSQIGVNRVLMDLIGARFPINGVRFPINAEEVRFLLWCGISEEKLGLI